MSVWRRTHTAARAGLCPHPEGERAHYPPPTGTVCTRCGAPVTVTRRLEM